MSLSKEVSLPPFCFVFANPHLSLFRGAERLVGVNSGGMDQSASVFSLSQHLLHM